MSKKKYVIFKNDDVGKNIKNLKKWVNIVIENDAIGSIGIIGKYLKNRTLVEYLNSLDKEKIEFFCHGFSHSYLPFLLRKFIGKNQILPTEFDRDIHHHNKSLKKYRIYEKKYLDSKTIVFGPPGNTWNVKIIDPLIKNGFKIMFSWRMVGGGLFTIPITDNFNQIKIEDFINNYRRYKERSIYTLQFHHANINNEQFELLSEVIYFLKNKEKRFFLKPSELFNDKNYV